MEDNQVQQVEQEAQKKKRQSTKTDIEKSIKEAEFNSIPAVASPVINNAMMKLIKELQEKIDNLEINLRNHTHPGNGSFPTWEYKKL